MNVLQVKSLAISFLALLFTGYGCSDKGSHVKYTIANEYTGLIVIVEDVDLDITGRNHNDVYEIEVGNNGRSSFKNFSSIRRIAYVEAEYASGAKIPVEGYCPPDDNVVMLRSLGISLYEDRTYMLRILGTAADVADFTNLDHERRIELILGVDK